MHDMNGAVARGKNPPCLWLEWMKKPGILENFCITKKSMPKDLISHKNQITTSGSLATSSNPLSFPRILRHPQQTSHHQKITHHFNKSQESPIKIRWIFQAAMLLECKESCYAHLSPGGSSFCLKCSKGTIFQQLVSCTNVT